MPPYANSPTVLFFMRSVVKVFTQKNRDALVPWLADLFGSAYVEDESYISLQRSDYDFFPAYVQIRPVIGLDLVNVDVTADDAVRRRALKEFMHGLMVAKGYKIDPVMKREGYYSRSM